jgi:DedD protein
MADPNNSALEAARKRARRRLVGVVVLALAAAVVLPMFLESDPKPLGPDVQIQIPAIDDAKFQNRLTPPGASQAPAVDKAAQPAPSEPVKAPRETADTGAAAVSATTAAVTDSAVNTTEPPASAPAPAAASKPGETKPAIPPASLAIASPSAAPARKSAVPANPPAVTPPAATSPAVTPPAAAPAKKSTAPVLAPATAPATAASLPAFSLTATLPSLDAAVAPNPKSLPSAVPPLAQGEFVVQLGAFVDSAVAKDLAAKAGEQGFSVFLEAVTTKSGQVQRVRVGPFATRGEADVAAAKLKTAGFTAVALPR